MHVVSALTKKKENGTIPDCLEMNKGWKVLTRMEFETASKNADEEEEGMNQQEERQRTTPEA